MRVPAGPTDWTWRTRTRRPRGRSAVDSDVVDAWEVTPSTPDHASSAPDQDGEHRLGTRLCPGHPRRGRARRGRRSAKAIRRRPPHQRLGALGGTAQRLGIGGVRIDAATTRAVIKRFYDTTTDEIVGSSEIYARDAVLEFPQGKDRIACKPLAPTVYTAIGVLGIASGLVSIPLC